ncbi:MAG: Uncharacterised protein [Halieaceae bacterium]|nr:MAG: Uncharacterised protein [Halieaceae bacterium]
MNPEMMLSQLAPLREPVAIGWWPLAPGWWVALALTVALLVGLGLWLRKRRLKTAYRRVALAALDELRTREARQDELNWLLKAAALKAYPHEQVAGLHGTQWQQFLASSCPKVASDAFGELDSLYQREPSPVSSHLFDAAEHWIRQHEVTHA